MSTEAARDVIADRIAASEFDGVVKFDCGNDGVLVIDGRTVHCDDADAQCTIGVTLTDLMAMIEGQLNPTVGFMQGKLKIDGDLSAAMRVASLL